MKLMGIVGVDIDHAASIIANGGVVAFPTETVYGLGANALNPNAVAKVFALKERPSFDPLIVHIASAESINLLSSSNDPRVFQLAERFWPGPLTIVVPKSTVVPGIVTSDLDTVGIRMPNHPIALELIKKSGCVIAAPSANKFGRVSPTRAEHVLKQLPEVDYILDGGRTTVGIESTVITLDEEGFIILRHGAITHSHLAQVLKPSGAHKPLKGLASPDCLNRTTAQTNHYTLLVKPANPLTHRGRDILPLGKPEGNYKRVEYLSETGDMVEAAAHLLKNPRL